MQYEQVKELIEIFEKTDLNDMEVTLGNASVRLNRGMTAPVNSAAMAVPQQAAPVVAVAAPSAGVEEAVPVSEKAEGVDRVEETERASGDKAVKAPIVGTFYQSSAPDKAPFVKVGDTVAEGDVVCIIEAMKFMNEVTSEVSGTITDILVEDGQFVEFGQELFRVK